MFNISPEPLHLAVAIVGVITPVVYFIKWIVQLHKENKKLMAAVKKLQSNAYDNTLLKERLARNVVKHDLVLMLLKDGKTEYIEGVLTSNSDATYLIRNLTTKLSSGKGKVKPEK